MIFDPTDTDAQKVYKTRQHYLNVLSKLSPQRAEMERAYAFRHGNQWTEADKADLAAQGRPALTFNVIAPTMREMVGANEDQRREARAAPVGGEDLPTSESINHLWKRVYEQARVQIVESAAFDDMVTGGVGFVFIDAQPDERNPGQQLITFDKVQPFEVLWDPEAQDVNMKDAAYFYWSRWMSEVEFKEHYPEHGEQFEEIMSQIENSTDGIDTMRAQLETQYSGKLSSDGLTDSKFYDRKNRRLRILHLEYKMAARRHFVWDPREDGQGNPRGFVPVSKSSYDMVKKSGAFPTQTVMGSEWRWLECTGAQLLFDDKQPLPIYCSQLHPVTCYYDPVKQMYYGMIRDLVDPQSEFNKRKSQEMNLLVQQAQPGAIGDENAFGEMTPDQVERKLKEPGFYLERTPGKLVEFRDPPPANIGAEKMSESALGLVQMISGVDVNPLLGGHGEQVAVGTAMLNHRKGLISIQPVLQNFREGQQKMLSSVVETILLGFGDDQIEAMLGSNEKLQVQDGVIYDAEDGSAVPIRDLRTVQWNIEMETAAANTTQQMIIFNLLQTLRAQQVPIDPDVLFSYFPGSREERLKLATYFKMAEQMSMQAAQQQAAQSQQQVDNVLKVEHMRTVQKDIEARIEADVKREGQEQSLMIEFLKLMLEAATAQGENANVGLKSMIDAAKVQVARMKVATDASARAEENQIYRREASARAAAPAA